MNKNTVSVCMAAYNGEKVIKRQVLSILVQLSADDELIIVDDCSTDNTHTVINSFHDSRIKIFRNKHNLGVNKSFERALMEAKGEIVFLSDQDDEWLPNKKSIILKYFEDNDWDILQHDACVVDENGEIINDSFFAWRKYCTPNVLVNFIRDTHLGCCMAFRRNVIKACLPITDIPYHDKWIGIVAPILGYKEKYVNDVLIKYTRCNESTTSIYLKRRSLAVIVIERLKYVKEIIAFLIKRNNYVIRYK